MQFEGVKQDQPKINLFFNWYESKDRQHEIDQCLEINKMHFDCVVILEGRPTFSEMFERSKEFPNDINVYCNSDIYFPKHAVQQLHNIKENECYALTRYDYINGNPVFFNRSDSQDSWIFRGVVKPIKANFPLGKWGGDNHLAWLIKNAGYDIKNPSLSIQTIHVHKVDRRVHARTESNTVKPPYLQIPPTRL